MTSLAVVIGGLLALAALVAFMVWQARRQGAVAATTTALAQAEAQTIKNLQTSEAIHESVNADPDLAARARTSGFLRDPAAK